MTSLEKNYRGFRLRELFAQADCLDHLYGMRNAGGLYFHRTKGRYEDFPEVNADNFADEPRNTGLTRDLAFGRSASWVGSLFLYRPPQVGFTRSEQRLLLSALDGGTDSELNNELGLSLSAVKQAWRAIYGRVAACLPDLVPDDLQEDPGTQDRGKQKKQRLLAYLREHPEELRPLSRKLLQRHSAEGRPLSGSKAPSP
jgi:hypothetical protein